MWRFRCRCRHCCLSPLWSNGQITRDPAQLPNVFNDFFSTVGPKLASVIRTSNHHFSGFLPPRQFANSCSHFTWKPHIDNAATVKTIGVTARLRHFVSQSTLLNLYRSLIFPHLSYGLITWGQASKLHKILLNDFTPENLVTYLLVPDKYIHITQDQLLLDISI